MIEQRTANNQLTRESVTDTTSGGANVVAAGQVTQTEQADDARHRPHVPVRSPASRRSHDSQTETIGGTSDRWAVRRVADRHAVRLSSRQTGHQAGNRQTGSQAEQPPDRLSGCAADKQFYDE